MGEPTPDELIEVLNKRRDVVRILTTGVGDKTEITELSSVSRPTIDRAFRELDELGIVRTQGSDVDLTSFGRLAIEQYLDLEQQYDDLCSLAPLLPDLPADIDTGSLSGADLDVIHLEDTSPHEFHSNLRRTLTYQEELFVMMPVIHPHFLDYLGEVSRTDAAELNLVFPEEYRTDAVTLHGETLETILKREQHTVEFTTGEFDTGFILADERECCIVVVEQGTVEGLITTDDQAVVSDVQDTVDTILSDHETIEAGPSLSQIGDPDQLRSQHREEPRTE
jgi:predicted transcriptional regulator